MNLLYLATLLYTEGAFASDIITFVSFMHCFKSRNFDSILLATLEGVAQKIHQSEHSLPLTIQLALNL